MIDNERKLYEQRIEVFLKRLTGLFYEDELEMQTDVCPFQPIVPFSQRLSGAYRPIQQGETWGKNWERAWFHVTGATPENWRGKRVVALINIGGEGLVFDEDGTPVTALSIHSLWLNHFRRDRLDIAARATGRETIDYWIEGSAGQLFGLQLEQDRGDRGPVAYGNYEAAFQYARLAVFRKDIWELYMDCFVLNDLMRALPEKNVRRARILRALMRAIDCFQPDEGSVQRTRDVLKPELEKPGCASDLTTRAVGHAHLDTAWLWPIHETIRKCARTFSSQLQLIEKYPGYVFGASMPQHYLFVKENYPSLYEKIKARIAEGRWEVQGGMWVEADCNIISGESLVRQILHGKNFYQDEFNIDVKNLWLPDVFGYSAALPQILKKAGIDFFVTQKLSWNQFNKLPNHTFIWRGIDGSEVITHFPPEDNYGSELRPSKLIYAQENFAEHDYLDQFLTLFGIGDGGCGPTEEMLETGRRLAELENCPKVQFGAAQDFLNYLAENKDLLPRWVGELYFELHRGTLTTQAYNKKMNRFMELKLRELEILYALLPLKNYPSRQFDAMWKKVLLNQFHDIIPGSSITPVYEQCREDYAWLHAEASQLARAAGDLLFDNDDQAMTVFNSLSCIYSRPIVLPDSWQGYDIVDDAGQSMPVQAENQGSIMLVEIPPFRSVTVRKGRQNANRPSRLDSDRFILENELVRYEFTDAGVIQRAYDKESQREILATKASGNRLCLYEDRPANWDAWDIDIFYENQLLEQARVERQEWLCQGPLRQGFAQKLTIGHSHITQRIYLAANSKRLDFETEVNWQETHRMLRVAFPVNVFSDVAVFEIQYGLLKRSTHRNTSWDRAKFEVVGHRFADLADRDYGVALLNDCKYGYNILDNVIDLNLLRATTMPDPVADRGFHSFTYSLFPHAKDTIESGVWAEALQLNQPPACYPGYAGAGITLPFTIGHRDIIVEVVKKAEREDALILRCYEPRGRSVTARLTLLHSNATVFETDLMEQKDTMLERNAGQVALTFGPFEIKTLKLTFH
ncbi:MAG: alpha-mannosidase [Candidatus Zhuqueibacterota bacterium]